MEVTFATSIEDLVYLNWLILIRNNKVQFGLYYVLAGLMGTVSVLLLLWLRANYTPSALVLLVGTLMMLCGSVFTFYQYSPLNLRRRLLRLTAQTPGILCEHTISIETEWLREVTSVNDTRQRWQAVHLVLEDTRFILLFLTPRIAHGIPKAAFATPHEAQAFFQAAHRYWEAANSGIPVASAPEDTTTWPPPPQTLKS